MKRLTANATFEWRNDKLFPVRVHAKLTQLVRIFDEWFSLTDSNAAVLLNKMIPSGQSTETMF